MGKSITVDKSKSFAIRIVNLYKYLIQNKREYVMSKQLLRSGTSIGANLSEAIYGISEKDFTSKIFIALKESSETIYWLDLLHNTGYLSNKQYESINNDCIELVRLLTATAKTLNEKIEEA
ncbi:MAG: four helix bundle protein [Muribaculaceae bacterium]